MIFDNTMYVAAIAEYNDNADVWKNTTDFIKERPDVFNLKKITNLLSIGTGEFYSNYHLHLIMENMYLLYLISHLIFYWLDNYFWSGISPAHQKYMINIWLANIY